MVFLIFTIAVITSHLYKTRNYKIKNDLFIIINLLNMKEPSKVDVHIFFKLLKTSFFSNYLN